MSEDKLSEIERIRIVSEKTFEKSAELIAASQQAAIRFEKLAGESRLLIQRSYELSQQVKEYLHRTSKETPDTPDTVNKGHP